MARISTRFHGMLDYGSALILLAPWITGFFTTQHDTLWLAVIGSFTLLVSLFTDYEFGLIKLIPMRVHLLLDVIHGAFPDRASVYSTRKPLHVLLASAAGRFRAGHCAAFARPPLQGNHSRNAYLKVR